MTKAHTTVKMIGVLIFHIKLRKICKMERVYKRSRLMYIIEAGLEYLISILVADMYLARLTKELGLGDNVTGILSAIISLGCLFQLVATLLHRGKSKPIVMAFSVLNQLLFMFLYVIPLTSWEQSSKQVMFIITIVCAYFFYNIVHPKKINWLMSLVDDHKRGRFTALKEVVSLVSGVVFNFAMGALIEHFEAQGNIRGAFITCGVAIFGIMLLHTLTMLLTVEKEIPPQPQPAKNPKKLRIFDTLKDKNVLKVTLVFCLWQISNACATPFYGAYKENDLGFTTVFGVAILGAIYALARSIFSFVWGKYADKYSFARMLQICFSIAGASFLVNAFCRPENGYVVYTIYYVLYAIAMAGINSALINLCYDYVSPAKRTDALAVSLAISGVCGFLTTLAVSPIVSAVQKNGNMVLGVNIYAQQILSAIAALMTIITMLYVTLSMVRGKKEPRAIRLTEEREDNE